MVLQRVVQSFGDKHIRCFRGDEDIGTVPSLQIERKTSEKEIAPSVGIITYNVYLFSCCGIETVASPCHRQALISGKFRTVFEIDFDWVCVPSGEAPVAQEADHTVGDRTRYGSPACIDEIHKFYPSGVIILSENDRECHVSKSIEPQ